MTVVDLSAKYIVRTRLKRWWNSPVAWARDCLPSVTFAPYQAEVLDALPREHRVAVRGPHGLGKATALSVLLPQSTGWTTVGEVLPGDEILDENGKVCRVTGKSPVYLGPTYEVEFANGDVITAHGEHEWSAIDVYHRPKGIADWRDHWAVSRTRTTAYLADHLRSPSGQLRWRVPAARPLELPAADLLVDPYALGIWLGDGTTSDGSICLNREDAEHIVSRLPGGHFFTSGEREGSRMYRVPGWRAQLREIGVLGDKHIPMAYLRASIEQRRELVRGLWDSDGYRQVGGCDEIMFSSERLAQDTAELLRTLGLVVRVRTKEAKIREKSYGTVWRIGVRFDFNPYHLPRYDWTPRGNQASRHTQHTITDIRRVADQPTQCIEVDSPSHLYLTGRSMIPTHNSFKGAVLVNWFATTRELAGKDWKIITTASAWRHLEVYLWPEIHKWAGRIDFETLGRAPFKLNSELLDLRLKLQHGAATAVASNQPERIEGAHAEELLYLLDEAKIVPPATWDSIEGAFSNAGPDTADNAYAFAMSTPGPPAGRFYEIHKKAPGYEDWWTRWVTLEEAVAAGRISRAWADQRRLQWGADSAVFHNRVLGEFHASDEDSVIPLAWLEAAIERWHEWDRAGRPSPGGPLWTGIDVGRGGDDSVLANRDGWAVTLTGNRRRDTMSQVAEMQGLAGRAIVDAIGVGAGVYDRMRELGLRPLAYIGSGKTNHRDRSGKFGFVNCLTGESRIRPIGGLRRVYRARYEGPLFKIETARGDHFTATPNHQVMTPRGWVAVQSLHVGDQLCDSLGGDPAGSVAPARPEVDDVPAQIGEIYRAADRLFGSERVQGRAVNFHGDAPVGDVQVVTIDRDLLTVGETGGEAAEDVQLIRSLLGPSALTGEGATDQSVVVAGRAPGVGATLPDHTVPGGPGTPLIHGHPVHDQVPGLLRSPALHSQVIEGLGDDPAVHAVSLAECEGGLSSQVPASHLITWDTLCPPQLGDRCAGAERHSSLPEDPADDVLVYGQVEAQSVDRGSSLVTLDQVVSIEIDSSGHESLVYTLETDTGMYRSQYTTHKNCRSAAYWNLRELLDPAYEPLLALPPDDLMISDLTTPTWSVVTGSPPKYQILTKDEVVKRLGRSSDRGDAIAMAMWADLHVGAGTFVEPQGQLPSTGLSPLGRRVG